MNANASDKLNVEESRKILFHDRGKKKTTFKKSKPEVIIAPEGGWGWVVCFSCFMTHFLTDGLFYSFGVVFVELLDYFKGSKAGTAFIPSLTTGVCLLIGPLVAALTNRFGCRAVAVAGTCITSGSFIISIFAPNIYFLYFSFGVLAGVGYGMVYFPTIVSVTQYFDKRRALATGLGVCGSGIGTFVFSPITKLLLETYRWQGTLLVQAGLILNCLACGLVLRPIDKVDNYVDADEEGDTQWPSSVLCTSRSTADENAEVNDDADDAEVENAGCSRTHNMYGIAEPNNKDMNSTSVESSEKQIDITNVLDVETVTFITAEEKNLINKNVTKVISCHNDMDDKTHTPKNSRHKEKRNTAMWTSIKGSFHLDILKNKALTLFTISTFFYTLGFFVPYIYLPDKANNAGIGDYKGAWLLSAAGISNTVGRVVFGFISDRKCVNRLYLYNTALVLCGVATSFGTLFDSFESLLIYSVLFGLFSGVTVSLTSVILADIVGVERMPDAFGVCNFFAGIAALIGPPIAGWLFDVTGSYDTSFVVTGVIVTFSGVMLFFLPCIKGNVSF